MRSLRRTRQSVAPASHSGERGLGGQQLPHLLGDDLLDLPADQRHLDRRRRRAPRTRCRRGVGAAASSPAADAGRAGDRARRRRRRSRPAASRRSVSVRSITRSPVHHLAARSAAGPSRQPVPQPVAGAVGARLRAPAGPRPGRRARCSRARRYSGSTIVAKTLSAGNSERGPVVDRTGHGRRLPLGTPCRHPFWPDALAPLTTLRSAGPRRPAGRGRRPRAEVVDAVRAADAAGEPLLLLGGGSNVVIADEGWPGTVAAGRAAPGARSSARPDGSVLLTVEAGRGLGRAWSPPPSPTGSAGWSACPASRAHRRHARAERRRLRRGGRRPARRRRPLRPAHRRGPPARPGRRARARLPHQRAQGPRRRGGAAGAVRAARRRRERPDPLPRAGPGARRRARGAGARARRPGRRCCDLRRGKGMVLDAADHDTWSVGSFFTNPVLPDGGRPRAGRAALARRARPGEGAGGLADRARRLPPRPRRARAGGWRCRASTCSRSPTAATAPPPTCSRWPGRCATACGARFGVELAPRAGAGRLPALSGRVAWPWRPLGDRRPSVRPCSGSSGGGSGHAKDPADPGRRAGRSLGVVTAAIAVAIAAGSSEPGRRPPPPAPRRRRSPTTPGAGATGVDPTAPVAVARRRAARSTRSR